MRVYARDQQQRQHRIKICGKEFFFLFLKIDKNKNRPRSKAKSDPKNLRGKRGARKSTVDTPHALVGHGLTLVNDLNAEMEGCPVRHIVRNERDELLDYLLHV